MKLIDKNKDQITFEAKIEDSLANSIRRYINHIPVLAVDEVEIIKNDSPLYDETVAHRIGLIPLKSDKVGKKESIKIKLSTDKEGMVYSKEMKGDAKPVHENIPITFLNKGQELEFEAVAKLGTGSEHGKFSPGMMYYRNVSEITMDKEFKDKIKSLFKDNEINDKGNKIIVVDNRKKEIADFCESVAGDAGKKAEVELKEGLVITVESFGQFSPEEVFKKSISELKEDLEKASKKIDKE